MNKLVEALKIVGVLDPSADRYDTNPASHCVSLRQFNRALFLLRQKTSTSNTGTATVTLEACSAADGTGATAIPYDYYANESVASSDAFGAKLSATSAGFTTTANKDSIYAIEIRGNDLPRGFPFVRLKLTEVVNDPVVGDVIAILGDGPAGAPNDLPTVIA